MRILSIGGDPDKLALRNRYLASQGHVVHGVQSRRAIDSALLEHPFDIVVIWDDLPEGYSSRLTSQIAELQPGISIVRGRGAWPRVEIGIGDLRRAADIA